MELETEIYFRNGDLQRCFDMFKDMKQKRELCDVTFQTGNTSISAHRVVIAASIPYFRDSLSSARDDTSLATIEPGIFKCFIEYAYSREMKINTENVRDLLSGACYLDVKEVKDACCEFLSVRLQPKNVISLRDLACQLGCWNLLGNINCYIRENFVAVSQTEDFLYVPFLYIKELIGRDDLVVSNEEKVFEAVMKWTKALPEERKTDLPQLLRKVRMPLLKIEYLTDKAGQEELIRTSIPCRDLVDEAKNHLLFPTRSQSASSFSAEPRCCVKRIDTSCKENTLIFNVTMFTTYIVERFRHDKKEWKTVYLGNEEANSCAFAALNNNMYFFSNVKSVEYNTHGNAFRIVKSMSFPRCFSIAVAFGNRIVVCGGSVADTAQNTVESFDPQKNEWTSLNPLRKRRAGPCAATLAEYIYVFGGTDYSVVHDSVERYDSDTGKWSLVSRMLTKRCIASAATLKGKIYVCGGDSSPTAGVLNCIATCEVYDPNENIWSFVSPMKIARCEVIALPLGGKLYALGGFDSGRKCISTVEIYDPECDKWELGPPPQQTDHFLSSAVAL